MVEFQGLKDSNKKKSHEKDVCFVHKQNQSKVEAKIGFKDKQQKIDCLIFARRYFARKQINSLCE